MVQLYKIYVSKIDPPPIVQLVVKHYTHYTQEDWILKRIGFVTSESQDDADEAFKSKPEPSEPSTARKNGLERHIDGIH